MYKLSNKFRVIPSVEKICQSESVRQLEKRFGHQAVVSAIREETKVIRETLRKTKDPFNEKEALKQIEQNVIQALSLKLSSSLEPVINGSGVIIHTNLGRAPLSWRAIQKISSVSNYSNLELNLQSGTRGSRTIHAQSLLQQLSGAEDALVVNNNAAAMLLILSALGNGREVIISRGELIEIGGGFRIPDVLRQSGARLREVGTTNRTRADDYTAAINDKTALILRVHPSNFRIEGFTERPRLRELTDISRKFSIPIVEDIGSGNLSNNSREISVQKLFADEPTVIESIGTGVNVCCFSGDKLLGGPQAGLIVGQRDIVGKLRDHPLMRALRVDKLTYAALEATLIEHLTERAQQSVPVLAMINTNVEELKKRAAEIIGNLKLSNGLKVNAVPGESTIGGGTTPGLVLPSCLLSLRFKNLNPNELSKKLRSCSPAIVSRIESDNLLLDLRTIQPDEDEILTNTLKNL
tara:strand:- start:7143 stop:8543 length:1401 start_codon:yes stop_codon:yes gene_type:complete